MAQKNRSRYRARRQSTLIGHISKEVWVPQGIAGGELCVIRHDKRSGNN